MFWFINFSRSREQGDPIKTTMKVFKSNLLDAIDDAIREYRRLNNYDLATAKLHLFNAGPWDEDEARTH